MKKRRGWVPKRTHFSFLREEIPSETVLSAALSLDSEVYVCIGSETKINDI